MTVEIFSGSPEKLKVRIDALVVALATINSVILSHEKGKYIILYTP